VGVFFSVFVVLVFCGGCLLFIVIMSSNGSADSHGLHADITDVFT